MAPISYILFFGIATSLPFVENAPSNIVNKGLKEEEFHSRLIFIDLDDDDVKNSDTKINPVAVESTAEYETENSGLKRLKHFAKSIVTEPVLEVKALKSPGQSKMDDERQIWGIAVENKELEEDESYYNRPLALPKDVVKVPSKSINRVSQVLQVTESPKPSACDMAIVICCENPSKLKECFASQGCINATEDMFAHLCSMDSINRIIETLGKYYKGNSGK